MTVLKPCFPHLVIGKIGPTQKNDCAVILRGKCEGSHDFFILVAITAWTHLAVEKGKSGETDQPIFAVLTECCIMAFAGERFYFSDVLVDLIFSMAIMFSDIASLSTSTAVLASRFLIDI